MLQPRSTATKFSVLLRSTAALRSIVTIGPNALRLREKYPYRILPARWQKEVVPGSFRATVRVQADDVPGLVNKIAEVINRDLKINIRSMSLNSAGGILSGLINIEVTSTQVVDTVVYKLMKLKGVQKVYRVNN